MDRWTAAVVLAAAALSAAQAHGHEPPPASAAGANLPEINAPAGLLAAAQGRELLRYIVQCALPAHERLTAQVDGQRHEFTGSLGLAPRWSRQAPDAAEQRWVSACVLSRVNFFGVTVPLSLQGGHPLPDLRTRGDEERRTFPIEEGAFYGNLFVPRPVAYVCKGKGPMTRGSWVGKRVCTQPRESGSAMTRCDFILTGACRDVCASQDPVSGAYLRCKAPDGQVYDEVLTTYLRED